MEAANRSSESSALHSIAAATVVGSSLKTSFRSALENSVSADFYIGEDQHLDKSFQLQRLTTLKVTVLNHGQLPVPRARVSVQKKEGGAPAR